MLLNCCLECTEAILWRPWFTFSVREPNADLNVSTIAWMCVSWDGCEALEMLCEASEFLAALMRSFNVLGLDLITSFCMYGWTF